VSTGAWIVVCLVAWGGVAVLVGVLLGRVIRGRDDEVEAQVQVAMETIDDELAELLGGKP
jgi:hypothetical protein